MKLTDEEQRAWKRAYDDRRESERRRCTQPITPVNPVKPRERQRSLSGSGGTRRR